MHNLLFNLTRRGRAPAAVTVRAGPRTLIRGSAQASRPLVCRGSELGVRGYLTLTECQICLIDARGQNIPPRHDQLKYVVFSQASMTGSALSLYLEETKVNEDSMFPPEISPIRREDVSESKIQSNLTLLAGGRDNPAQGKREACDVLLASTLVLHKVQKQDSCCVCPYRVITRVAIRYRKQTGLKRNSKPNPV